MIDFVVNYIRAIDAHELCSKIGNCDDDDKPEPVAELGEFHSHLKRGFSLYN